MKVNLTLIGLGLVLIVLVSTNVLGFSDNTSAAMLNGFVYGLILSGIINIVAMKMGKK